MRSGRRVGRQQHTMPMLDSTDDQAAAGGLAYVGSGELEIAIREWRRRMETRHTLGWRVRRKSRGEHGQRQKG